MNIVKFFRNLKYSNKFQVFLQKINFRVVRYRKFVMRYLLLGKFLAFMKWLNPYAKGIFTFTGSVFFHGLMFNIPLAILFGVPFNSLMWVGLGLAYWIPEKQIKMVWREWKDHKLEIEGRKTVMVKKAEAGYSIIRGK